MKATKPPRVGGGPLVRQMRGPGMNKGLKKPRHGTFFSGDGEEQTSSNKKSSKGSTSSYLSDTLTSGTRKKRPANGGKVISSKNI